ncbi:MAG: hypothetical protein V7K97_21815 [Nostoc sp.]
MGFNFLESAQLLSISIRTSNSAKISDRLTHHQVPKGLPEKALVVL